MSHALLFKGSHTTNCNVDFSGDSGQMSLLTCALGQTDTAQRWPAWLLCHEGKAVIRPTAHIDLRGLEISWNQTYIT